MLMWQLTANINQSSSEQTKKIADATFRNRSQTLNNDQFISVANNIDSQVLDINSVCRNLSKQTTELHS